MKKRIYKTCLFASLVLLILFISGCLSACNYSIEDYSAKLDAAEFDRVEYSPDFVAESFPDSSFEDLVANAILGCANDRGHFEALVCFIHKENEEFIIIAKCTGKKQARKEFYAIRKRIRSDFHYFNSIDNIKDYKKFFKPFVYKRRGDLIIFGNKSIYKIIK